MQLDHNHYFSESDSDSDIFGFGTQIITFDHICPFLQEIKSQENPKYLIHPRRYITQFHLSNY